MAPEVWLILVIFLISVVFVQGDSEKQGLTDTDTKSPFPATVQVLGIIIGQEGHT